MLAIVGIIFPVFAAIALGYGTVWRGLFDQADLKVLGRFVLNIALPGLMFNAISGSKLSEALQPDWMLIYGASNVLSLVLMFGIFTVLRASPTRRAVASMGASCPNSGYIAYPIMLMAFPDVAAQTFAMAVVVENFCSVPGSIILCDLAKGDRDRSFRHLIGPILWGVIKRPMIIGLLLGVLVAALGLTVPDPIQRLLSMLGNATAAIALFVIGGSLVGLPLKGNTSAAFKVVLGKIVFHPLIAITLLAVAGYFGLAGFDPHLRASMIITAATPMMGIYTILAQDYGHEGMASISMLGATVGSFFTYTALLFYLM